MDNEVFKQLGFLDAEVIVYKALLKLGPTLVSKIHQETGLHRTHIYDLLEKLREKGLVSTFTSDQKKHFQAAPPENILEYIEEKKTQIEEKILPELIDLSNLPKENTTVELFKGLKGIKSVYNDIIKTGKNYYCIAKSNKQKHPQIHIQLVQFLKRIEKNNIQEKIVFDKKGYIVKTKNGSYKYLDSKKEIPTTAYIYGSKVALFILQPPFHVILIKNKDVADTYKQNFNFLWSKSKIIKNKDLINIKKIFN
ncbi:hypothetical protein HN587_00945 [Candidatus Woesearchaeota archaeon]|jgi:sugar-specific transcriptional regulator TrmB|nr:hypothetical protein [Candidatus Woesearchaeota archaeon]